MPIEIINPIPFEILAGGRGGGNYVLNTDAFDVAIDGIPFLMATNDQHPYTREVQDIQKQRFDNFPEPGEYSMIEWWLRSQSDFGGGQGLTYQDPDVDNRFNIKFKQSTGINVWNPGEIELLPEAIATQTPNLTGGTGSLSRGYFGGFESIPSVWYTDEENLYSYDVETAVSTVVNYSGADPKSFITGLTSVGNTYYVANTTGIYSGTGASAGTKLWNTGAQTTIEWTKGRLMAGIANKVYELVGSGPALPTPKFTHLNPGWEWTSITEGPTSIYFAGTDYPDASIYKFVLETDGAVPTLTSGGTVAAPMPPGELINTIYCYLGTYIGIATNRGFRVGVIDSQGDIAYGPLLWEKESFDICGDDRFFYVCVTNGIDLDPDFPDPPTTTFPGFRRPDIRVSDGVYRVDLGQQLQSADGSSVRFAYSTDRFLAVRSDDDLVSRGNMPIRSLTQIGDRYLFATYKNYILFSNNGWLALWPTDREFNEGAFGGPYNRMESGYFQTGRVRFNTQEPKMFRFFSTRAPAPLYGDIDVDVIDQSGGVTRYITYNSTHPPDVGDIPLSAIFTPMVYISLRFTLHRNTVDASQGAVMNGWQIKALPAPIRQRIFTMTLLCFDHEMDRTGQTSGYDGYSIERIQKIEQIAQRGNAITLQDLYNDTAAQVVIEQMQFVQLAPPGPNSATYGGYLTLRMKTVSDVIG